MASPPEHPTKGLSQKNTHASRCLHPQVRKSAPGVPRHAQTGKAGGRDGCLGPGNTSPPCSGLGRRRQQRGQQRGQGNLPSAQQHLHLQGRHSEHLAAAPPTFGLSPTLCHPAEAARLPSPSRGPRGLTKGSVFTPDPLGTQAATSSPRLCCRSRCPQRLLFALPFRLHTRQQLQE